MSFEFKGIHKVTKAPERVWVGNLWSIEVPVGFTYTVDPEKAGGLSGTYQLHVQNSKDCNFDDSYSSVFNFVVYEGTQLIDLNCDDMSDEALLQSLDELSSDSFGDYQLYRNSRDLAVLYAVLEESEEFSAYGFELITRGCNQVFTGMFHVRTRTISERKKSVLHWLDTINVLTQDERLSFTEYTGKSKIKIPTEYSKAMATIDPGIKISIPRGFHAETNQAVIGGTRKLVIVPESYSFSANPMEAPVALSLSDVPNSFNSFPTRAELMYEFFESFCGQGLPFDEDVPFWVFKNSDKAFTISQIHTGDESDAWIKVVSLLFANDNVYVIHLIINYLEDEYDFELASWDVVHLANAWLARIQVDGETVPNDPSSFVKLDGFTEY